MQATCESTAVASEYTLAWIEFLSGRFFFTIAGVMGVVALIAILYGWNLLSGMNFRKNVWPTIRHNPNALVTIYCVRVFSLAMFLGLLALAGAAVSTTY